MKGEKRAIRQLLRERRKALPAATVEAAGSAVHAQLREFSLFKLAGSVIAYIADENEIPTARLLDEVARSGRKLYLPQSRGLIRWQPGEPLVTGRSGVLEPLAGVSGRAETPVIALIPVVAWDERGTRLGRGGGFYDRLFASLTEGIARVGLAYEFQEFPGLPRDPWDAPLHYIITERRIVRCRSEVVREGSLQKGGLES